MRAMRTVEKTKIRKARKERKEMLIKKGWLFKRSEKHGVLVLLSFGGVCRDPCPAMSHRATALYLRQLRQRAPWHYKYRSLSPSSIYLTTSLYSLNVARQRTNISSIFSLGKEAILVFLHHCPTWRRRSDIRLLRHCRQASPGRQYSLPFIRTST